MTFSKGLVLTRATKSDAPRIADIHLVAFRQNGMLLAQFPCEKIRHRLRKTLVDKTVAEICDPFWEIMVVRDLDGDIVSFAKWCLPIPESIDYKEPPWYWPAGTDLEVLNEWTAKVDAAGESILGGTPCYRKYMSPCCFKLYHRC